MMKWMSCFMVLMVMISAGAVYNLKESTEALEQRKRQLQTQILEDKEAIKVLKAELAYLSRPERLQRLSERYLTLAPTKNIQLVSHLDDPVQGDFISEPKLQLVSLTPEVSHSSLLIADAFPVLLPKDKPTFEHKASKKPVRRSVPTVDPSLYREVQLKEQRKTDSKSTFYQRMMTKLEQDR